MKKYIFRRIIAIPFILVGLSVIIFSFTLFLTPSERVAVFINSPDAFQYVDTDELIAKYGLDKPFPVQYANWAQGVLRGELGWSTSLRMPVSQVLRQRIPATIELMLLGQIVIIASTVFLGTLAAKKHNQWIDNSIRFGVTISSSVPNFVIGLFLLIIFYVGLGWFAPGRLGVSAMDAVYSEGYTIYTGMHLIDSILNWRLDVFKDALSHIILPTIAYAAGPIAASTRLMRSSMLENMKRGYADTARVIGLREKTVIDRHVRRNALIPTVTFMGLLVPVLLGGSVIIETVFNYSGMGMFIVTAAKGLDFAAIIGASLAVCLIIMIANLAVDLLYGVLNPRLRQD